MWNMKGKYYKPPFWRKRRESMTHPFCWDTKTVYSSFSCSSSLNMNKSDTDKPRRIEHKRGNKREWNKLRMMFFLDSCKNNPLHNPDNVEQPNALKQKAHIYQEEIHILEAR